MDNLQPELQTFVHADSPFHAAGRLWTVPEIHYTRLPDGSTGIDGDELQRIHTAVANAVCGEPDTLNATELDFLCDVTDATLTEIAAFLRVDKSTASRWRAGSRGIPHSAAWLLKRWFWYRLFGDKLTDSQVSLQRLESDAALLRYIKDQAIAHQLTFAIQPHQHPAATVAHA